MSRLIFSVEAEQDIDELAEYIRALPLAPGLALAKALQNTISRMTLYPSLGKLDPEISRIVRRPIYRRICRDYVFFYTTAPENIEVVAVLHGKRNLVEILTNRATRF